MKCIFANNLHGLSFHDTVIKGLCFDGADMLWNVDKIYNGSMIGDISTIRFYNFCIEKAVAKIKISCSKMIIEWNKA